MISDLISRDALYDKLENAQWESDFQNGHAPWNLGARVQTIANMPTVDAAPVAYGEWIVEERHSISTNPYMDDSYYRAIVCSNCGNREASAYSSFGFPELKKRNYCPECGAKMDGNKTQI